MSQHMPKKVLMYSADTFGLGFFCRHLKIASVLQTELQDLSILLLSSSPMVHGFHLPPRVDTIKLPSLSWEGKGVFTSKYLPLPFEEVKRLRERIILETALTYQPHLFLVDHMPRGVGGELLSTLRALSEDRRRTAVVLGFRDIRDDPERFRARWEADRVMQVLDDLYDEIWIYGCQALYDPVKEYMFPDAVARKVRFCGYMDVEPPAALPEQTRVELGIMGETFVLVTVGGGRDGFPVLDTYLRALEVIRKDRKLFSLLIGGPNLPQGEQEVVRQRCRHMAMIKPDRPARFIEFSPRLLEYMAAADVVVSMGGYNTLVEILALEKRALIIPRVHLNLEQLIRASLFERLGLIRMLHPDQLSPETLAEALLAALHTPPPSRQHLRAVGFDLNGLHQVKEHVVRLLGARGLAPPTPFDKLRPSWRLSS